MLESKTNKGIKGCVRTPCPDIFAGQRKEVSSLVEEESTSGNCSGFGNASPQHWRRLWEPTLAKMSTPSRSRSSAMRDEGYFDYERQMQVSYLGPPHNQRLRGQGANSRHNQGAAYPGIAGVAPDMGNERPSE
ncbi:hypothetical protein AAG906_001000 [Vitis piasezkii]